MIMFLVNARVEHHPNDVLQHLLPLLYRRSWSRWVASFRPRDEEPESRRVISFGAGREDKVEDLNGRGGVVQELRESSGLGGFG